MKSHSEVLFIGGRSGVGKSSVGNEIHAQLSAEGVRHCFIEGDNLDMGYPAPWEHGLAERNLSAMWRNYTSIGYSRLIYTNTASVRVIDELVAAMGDDPRVTAVLLTATDATARERLGRREIGSALGWHIDRSNHVATELDDLAPDWVHRVKTDDRSVADISRELIGLTGWANPPQECRGTWREAGLVEVRAEAQRRVYSLRADPLAEIDAWLGAYRALWEHRLDALHTEIARGKRQRRRSR